MNKLSDNNDFIGLDISIHSGTDNHQDGDKRRPPGRHRNGRSSQTNSSIHKSRKRPRQQISQQSREENPKTSNKPKPPPAPPSSLVKLLQKDKSVLSYFLSLQENLEYDVDKWKREAKKWKNLAEQRGIGREAALSSEKVAETGSQTEGNGKSKNRKNAQSLLSKTSSTHEKISEPKKSTETNSQVIHGDIKNDDEGSTISITDDALFGGQESDENSSKLDLDVSDHCFRLSHDGDSDDEADKEKPESFVFSSKGQDSKQSDAEQQSLHNEKAEAQRRRQILDQLKEAKKCLDLLGVSLVEVEVTTTTVITPPSIYLPTATEAHVEARGSSDSADNSKGVVRKFMNDCDDENATFLLSKNAMDENMYRNSSTNAKNKIIFSNDEMAMPPTKTTTVEKILHRQSDEKVAAEMMASLKTLIKASSLIEFTAASHLHMDDIHKSDDGEEAPSKQENTDEALSQEDRMRRVRILRNYHPFCRDGKVHLPTVYFKEALLSGEESNNAIDSIDDEIESLPQHPASIGLQSILKILVIMDTYCRDDLFDDDWDKLFECPDDGLGPDDTRSYDEELMILQTGMRNRCRLANRISSSLDMEITRVWALTDRSSNLSTSSIHFHPADVFDPNDVTNTNGTHNGENKDDLPGSYSTKSFNRLVTLEERVAHARIATLLHRHDGDWQKAAEIVVGYIVSSAPTLKAENYPKLPPVLSLCILEALIAPEGYIPVNNIANEVKIQSTDPELGEFTEGWFYQQVVFLFDSILHDSEKSALQLMRALAFPVHVAGSIWKERSICIDDRIRDIAQVEVAAFERLKSTIDGAWLNLLQFDDTTEELIKAVGRNFLSASVSSVLPEKNERGTDPLIQMRQSPLVSGMTCLISLVTIGDIDEVISVCNKILLAIKGRKLDNGDEPHSNSCLFLLPACCYAYSNIICRTWETMKLGNTMGRHTASAFAIKDLFSPILNSITELIDSGDWENIDAIVQCCVLLGDGRSLLRFANSILPPAIKTLMRKNSETVSNRERNKISRIISVFVDAGEIPTVRVINLKRRPDRLLDFMSDAAKEQLIVIKGPAKLRTKSLLKKNRNATVSPSSVDVNEACSGFDAFDGLCGADELEDQLLNRLEGDGALSEFVRAKWRPGDLRAFDREARIGNELVATSITERACALSHIASWMGVEQSLSPLVDTGEVNGYEQKLIRMFKISGFARGPPLLHKNTDMEPVPVCVILEDDAVLGDRFTERLSSLLEELPRDFHFCSLGYSRPKTAPIVDFSSQLGIPSCLWYLTGYVLSLEGARYLIQSLPVTGPVDSWVGMKMCSNWDNVYGHWIGLGKHARATSKLPSKKDLSKIMKFRAFAALIPLCEQKVGKGGGDASVRVNWRDRDTDITYSG